MRRKFSYKISKAWLSFSLGGLLTVVGVGSGFFWGLGLFLRNLAGAVRMFGADADIPPQDVCVRAVETGSRFPQAAADFKPDKA